MLFNTLLCWKLGINNGSRACDDGSRMNGGSNWRIEHNTNWRIEIAQTGILAANVNDDVGFTM